MNIMAASSPADLVVTFRSIPRRLRESQGDAPASATGAMTAELRSRLELAARQLGCAPTPDAIADAIDAVPARDWDDSKLQVLRDVALEMGGVLRSIESAAAEWRR
jgi:hypothetical protein